MRKRRAVLAALAAALLLSACGQNKYSPAPAAASTAAAETGLDNASGSGSADKTRSAEDAGQTESGKAAGQTEGGEAAGQAEGGKAAGQAEGGEAAGQTEGSETAEGVSGKISEETIRISDNGYSDTDWDEIAQQTIFHIACSRFQRKASLDKRSIK